MYKIPAKTLFTGQKLIYVPECHSTNTSLAQLVENSDLPEGTVFITDHQTQGRGQRGNSWESGKGENVTLSILLRPKFLAAREQFKLNMAVSLGVVSALALLGSQAPRIKWPNDILVEGRKVGGILIENQSQGNHLTLSIVGIGLNVNQRQFSFPTASSLSLLTANMFDLNEVFQRVVSEVETRYLQLRSGSVDVLAKDYHNLLFKRGISHAFEIEGVPFEGTITGVDESGRLCMMVGGKERTFSLKEVRMVL